MKFRIAALFLGLGLLLTACDRAQVARWFASQDQANIGRQYLDDIRSNNLEPVRKALDPSLQTPQTDQALDALAGFLYAGETPKTVRLVINQASQHGAATVYSLGYEYEFAEGWRLIELVLTKTGAVTKISGLHTYTISASVEEANRFTFAGKASRHFLFLGGMALLALFTLFTAIACWRTPMRFKPLWLVFILLGLGEITLNWNTGAVYYDYVAAEIFAAGFTRDLMGAYSLQIGLPLGAMLFWIFRGKLRASN